MAILSQILIFPLFDIRVSIETNVGIAAWFTAISIARSYIVRRWFNAGMHKAIARLANKLYT